ncbi:MAG: excinuclease ABC subunit C, partial [Parcubacteria group bacterium SW_4_46_8]
MYYVYTLQLKNGQIYTGRTNNLKRRLKDHKKGKVESTRSRVDKLVHYEAYRAKAD